MDQRHAPRFPVQFRSSFSSPHIVAGEGQTLDLSLRGCRVETDTAVPPGTELELRIYRPPEPTPIAVDSAAVRWARGREFGVEFLRLQSGEVEQLHRLLMDVEGGPTQQ